VKQCRGDGMVDMQVLNTCEQMLMWVQLPSSVPII